MRTVLFYYTLIIMLVSALACALSLAVFTVTRRRGARYACIGFLVYFFDVALTFRTDYVTEHRDPSVFAINSPIESTLLGAGLIASFWLLILDYLQMPRRIVKYPIIIFAIWSATALLALPEGRWQEFCFFSARDAMAIGLLVLITIYYLRLRDQTELHRLRQHRGFYLAAWFFALGTVAWNIYFQLLCRYPSGSENLLFLPERNFAENGLLLACATQVGIWAARSLRMRYDETPRYHDSDPRQEFFTTVLRRFGHEHGLSPRECEVMALIVQGLDNRAIARRLVLAESTAKVHVHNILHKTSMGNRTELTKAFWATM